MTETPKVGLKLKIFASKSLLQQIKIKPEGKLHSFLPRDGHSLQCLFMDGDKIAKLLGNHGCGCSDPHWKWSHPYGLEKINHNFYQFAVFFEIIFSLFSFFLKN